MTDKKLNKVIDTIRKLLALSESNNNEHEAALAAAKASELLMKYELKMSQIAPAKLREEILQKASPWSRSRRQRWEAQLAFVLARHYFCQALVATYCVFFVGKERHQEIAIFVYEQLVAVLTKMAKRETGNYIKQMREEFEDLNPDIKFDHRTMLRGARQHKAWRSAWLDGAIVGINQQLNKQRKKHESKKNSKALLALHGREVQDYLQRVYPNLKSYKSAVARNSNAWSKGFDAGKSIQINKGISG